METEHTDEMWHKLLCRLRREDYSKIYAWLAREEDMFHVIPSDQTLLVVEQFERANVAKTFCQVARMAKERLHTDDFSVELQLELLKFERADQISRASHKCSDTHVAEQLGCLRFQDHSRCRTAKQEGQIVEY